VGGDKKQSSLPGLTTDLIFFIKSLLSRVNSYKVQTKQACSVFNNLIDYTKTVRKDSYYSE